MVESNNSRDVGSVFVGRQPEMAELTKALNEAMSGRGRMVMLAGEPGIGKTRTAQELASYAGGQGVQVTAQGICDAVKRLVGYSLSLVAAPAQDHRVFIDFDEGPGKVPDEGTLADPGFALDQDHDRMLATAVEGGVEPG